MSLAAALARMPARFGFAFTPDGRRAARAVDRDGDVAVEELGFGAGSHPCRVYEGDADLSSETQVCFPSADRIWIRSGVPGSFRLMEARRITPGGWDAHCLAESGDVSLCMLPDRARRERDTVVTSAEDATSTIWRRGEDGHGLVPAARIPGFVTGAAWIETPRTLAVNLYDHDRPSSAFLVDLTGGTYHRLFHVSDHSNDSIASCQADPAALWVTSDCFGYRRAGIAEVGGSRKVRFFDDPPGAERSVDPMGRYGRHLVLRRRGGVANELWLADPASLGVSPLALPTGVVCSTAADAGNRLRFAFSAPSLPAVCSAYLPAAGRFEVEEPAELGSAGEVGFGAPDVVPIPTRTGPVETLVYRRARGSARSPGGNAVVVALHGGPVAQWSAAFSPELQLFAGLGALVAAPNYHGSIGYGAPFVEALREAGVSIDVDDVVAVVHAMRRLAGSDVPVVLYGQSYGAFLALLTAALHPHLCDGVIAVAPFTSLQSIRAAGVPSVQRVANLVLGAGRAGEPNLLRICGDLRARVLIVHGGRDRVVPIAESRELCAALRARGHVDGRDLWFVPLPEEGHTISGRSAVQHLYELIESFLSCRQRCMKRPA